MTSAISLKVWGSSWRNAANGSSPGAATCTWRSKRPGRRSAWSNTSGRLVAAITIMLVEESEAVHFDQQLVQRLFTLVVAAAQAHSTAAADGVDLVDKDDARAAPPGLLEQVAHATGADADEHLDELGARDTEKWYPPLHRRRRVRAASCPCRAGPTSNTPRGNRAPSAVNRAGPLRNSTTSWSSRLASSTPATSSKVTRGRSGSGTRARVLPNGACRAVLSGRAARAARARRSRVAVRMRSPRSTTIPIHVHLTPFQVLRR